MRVLIIHRYFWPDSPPYGWMLRAIAGRWAIDRHDVTVLTSQPSYNKNVRADRCSSREALDGFTVRRVSLLPETKKNFVLRAMNLLLFMTRISAHVLSQRRRYDVVMAATTPPVMVAWIASLAAKLRGSQFIYHCQDIHPELLRYAGLLSNRTAYSALRAIDTSTVNRACRTVVLSTDMQETLEARDKIARPDFTVINNFTVPEYTATRVADIPEATKAEGKFRVVFAGNLGYFQGLESVVDAAAMLADQEEIEFVFLGDGAAKPSLIARAGDLVGRNLRFLGYRPQHEAEAFVRGADLSVITLGPEIYRAAFPSKTMTYTKMGSPILAIVEPESELAKLIQERGLGYVAPPGDVAAIVSSVSEAATDDARIAEMRHRSRIACEALFSEASCLERWSQLLEQLATSPSLQPVFVIGAGRSGTKFIRDMLGTAADVATVPYDVGYVWRIGNEDLDHDELSPDQLTGRARDYIWRTLPQLTGTDPAANHRILLEKSVPNSLRVEFIKAVFPGAKFIHLVRDGRAVVESSIRQWQTPAETAYLFAKLRYFPWSNYRYAFWYVKNQLMQRFSARSHIWGPRYKGMEDDVRNETLETVCARQWRRCIERASLQLNNIDPGQVLQLRYEDFAKGEDAVRDLCEFAGTTDQDAVLAYYRENWRNEGLAKWRRALNDVQRERVMTEIGSTLEELGYAH